MKSAKRHLRFSRRCRCRCWSSGLKCLVDLYGDIYVSEAHTACIFRAEDNRGWKLLDDGKNASKWRAKSVLRIAFWTNAKWGG
jgi:hypothetical protein